MARALKMSIVFLTCSWTTVAHDSLVLQRMSSGDIMLALLSYKYKGQILIWKVLKFPIGKILFQTSRGRKQAKDVNNWFSWRFIVEKNPIYPHS